MTFTIIPGSSTAPTTFEGTDGVDQAAINSLPNDSTGVVVRGLGADDVINWGITLTGSSISGGQGNDIITPNIISGATLISGFINGNLGNDIIGNPQLGVAATISTVSGGQGGDTMYAGNLQSSIVNGNLGDDTITTGVSTAASVNTSDSSIFGGQGNDVINVTDGADGFGLTVRTNGYVNTIIDGNLGNDVINVQLDNRLNNTLFQNSTVAGGEGDDTINATTSEVAVNLAGGNGRDTILGGFGGDTINGDAGEDSLLGGNGNDTINGGNEDDVINGGFGADVLSGGTGSNRFVQRPGSTTDNWTFTPDIGGLPGLDAGDTFRFFGTGIPDIITDWQTGAGSNVIDTGSLGLLTGAFAARDMSYGVAIDTIGNFAIRGNYDVATQTFVVTPRVADPLLPPTGGDILVFSWEGGPNTTNFAVLRGAGASSLDASDFVVV